MLRRFHAPAVTSTAVVLLAACGEDQRWARSRLRVIRRNGGNLFRTDDRVLTRVNVELRSGRVTRVAGLF